MDIDFDAMNVQDLWKMMREDGEYELGFIDSFGPDGYSGPAWVHKQGLRRSFPAYDPKLMAEYLRIKSS